MLYDDTIAAIATPPGEGGVGIIRISGAAALPILQRIFVPARPGAWRPYRMRFGHAITAAGAQLDEALAVYMRAPYSFTAEDVVEISCHGGPLVVSRVLALALEQGARPAEPGEFTMRAFLNGRIDLAQAEATLDIIQARTETGLALAQAQLGGWLSGELRQAREILLGPLAYFTALVDFPEDEVEPQEPLGPMQIALRSLEQLLTTADQGIVYRQGARIALVGRPNAGKSSLLNALLRADRAIVTPIPGTTRDTLEETANLHGIPVVLVDTAGIAETDDPVERLGVARSRAALLAADLALLVLDASLPPTSADAEIAALIANKPTVLVLNKIDLLEAQNPEPTIDQQLVLSGAKEPTTNGEPGGRRQETRDERRETTDNLQSATDNGQRATNNGRFSAVVATSALSGAGLDDLTGAIAALLLGGAAPASERMVTSPRHRDALGRAAGHVRDAIAGYQRGVPVDLLAVDLTAAISAIGEITGEAVNEDLLSAIFSRFCIGK